MAAAIALLLACAGIAGTVSLSRIVGFRHFASDAFVGAVMGWYIGAFVQTRRRSGAYLPECLKILNNQPLQKNEYGYVFRMCHIAFGHALKVRQCSTSGLPSRLATGISIAV